MANLTEQYLNKELVDSIPEKLPPDYEAALENAVLVLTQEIDDSSYDEWLDAQQPDEQQLEYMAASYEPEF